MEIRCAKFVSVMVNHMEFRYAKLFTVTCENMEFRCAMVSNGNKNIKFRCALQFFLVKLVVSCTNLSRAAMALQLVACPTEEFNFEDFWIFLWIHEEPPRLTQTVYYIYIHILLRNMFPY